MSNPIRTFASDNYSTVHPDIMQFLHDINLQGHAQSYHGDTITQRAVELFKQAFGNSIGVLFVPSGTGANILGLKLLLQRPYESLTCSEVSHIFEEEAGALAANLGTHIFTVDHTNGKIHFDTLKHDVALRKELGFHSSLPKVVSIANTTEYGTYYTLEEITQLAEYCHANDMYLHMDGCRLPNAAAATGCSLEDYVSNAGVDVLSFGGAKNGLMNAEAVVVFNAPSSDLLRIQKQSLQLISKMRYVAGQFIPYLTDDLWLKNAQHSNMLATQLADGLREKLGSDVIFTQPVATNQVFCVLPGQVIQALRSAGHAFYDWNSPGEVRFVTSWDNTTEDVRKFLALIV